MYNFIFNVDTKVLFGRGQIDKLGEEIKKYSDNVLLVYGGGSIKKNGIYDATLKTLSDNNIEVFEISGVDPNPRIETVREGVGICKKNNIGAVLAVGGGSSIDCAKVISAGTKYDGDAWDIVLNNKLITSALPVFSVLTLSATGSEMNGNAVISNMSQNLKLGTRSPLLIPKASVLDPEYTFSVPKHQTSAGVADIMSHTFENYFTNEKGVYLQERFAESILKTCIHYGPIAYNEPENYDARANLMWASSWAINGLISAGSSNNWSVHPMEHELSAFYDITHGVGLAILTPAWMKYVLDDSTVDKFVEYGINVWEIDSSLDKYEIANLAIEKTKNFFCNDLHIPCSLREVGIDEEYLDIMAKQAVRGGKLQGYKELDENDVKNIYINCL